MPTARSHIVGQNSIPKWERHQAEALRRLTLRGTALAEAQVHTIRLRLLKIGARIRFSARRVLVSMSSGHPWQQVFGQGWAALRC